MKEYIERAAVETMLENAQIISDGEYCGYCTEDVNLGSIPAADVVEVRHGSWKIKEFAFSHCKKMSCSICGYNESRGPAWDESYGLPNYCPSCGARMDKGDEIYG